MSIGSEIQHITKGGFSSSETALYKTGLFFFITNHFSMHHSEWIPCDKSTVYPGDSISLASRHPPKTNIKHNTDRQRLTFCIEESHCDVRNSEMSVANLDWRTGQ
jgi:hypothetical protein